MKNTTLIVFLAAFVSLWFVLERYTKKYYAPTTNQGAFTAEVQPFFTGLPAPEFSLPDLSGTVTSLSHFRGSIVLVGFWTSW